MAVMIVIFIVMIFMRVATFRSALVCAKTLGEPAQAPKVIKTLGLYGFQNYKMWDSIKFRLLQIIHYIP